MKRRIWIGKSTMAGTAAVLGRVQSLTANEPSASRIIDCHTHFYDPSRPGGVTWPGKGTPLYRTVLPKDWLAVASPHGVRETVVVEASPLLEDNQWILDLAAKEKSIVGFVGNLDLADPEFAVHAKRFSANPIFRGIRARGGLASFEKSSDQMEQSARVLAVFGLELDLNGPSSQLPLAAQIAKAVPDLRIVINHLGASGDPQKLNPDWKESIKLVAAQPNVFMKVSALVEQVKCDYGQAPRDTSYYLPVLDHLWESFGENRLIYGSNWPVSDKGGPYDLVFKIVSEYFSTKSREACEKYFWKNSANAYQWKERLSGRTVTLVEDPSRGPIQVPFRRGLTLMLACGIANVGGWRMPRYVVLVRGASSTKVDIKRIAKMPSEDVLLEADDVIQIPY